MRLDQNNKGLALVIVLWIVILMTALVAIVSQTSRLDMKMATAAADEVRCRWACRAGTETAIGLLNEDLRATDCLLDLWCDNDEDYNNVPLERCVYSVYVTDEAGKLNVNTVTREQLMALPYMETQIADAILDWRDNDENPRSDGAESGYYQNLPFPYAIRNGPIKTVRELLQVRGMTKDLLYGEDLNLNGQLDSTEADGELSPPVDNGDGYLNQGWIAYLTCYSYEKNVDAEGRNRVNINQADEGQLQSQLGLTAPQARWIVQNRGSGYQNIAGLINDNSPKEPSKESGGDDNRADPIDLQTFSSIADRITTSAETTVQGTVNINTAPKEVLVALLGGGDQAEQLAESIIADRAGRLYGFQTIADLLKVSGMTIERFKNIAGLLTVRSNVFTVRCYATAEVSGAMMQTECVVDRSVTPCKVLYWYQGANY
ncbi:MAG TPA: type II secretion system protein GspK [Sedimentisphaerales bacterium]|nr:type II secretion system protein GspK [Sedimentisphaerales bacterium]HRS12069.1 type II secretion system protein GspK [Sedimentisphaerales bacterium]HRV48498.1 type II secretion system protein GspK [Sedimentisphaerales bacterium]